MKRTTNKSHTKLKRVMPESMEEAVYNDDEQMSVAAVAPTKQGKKYLLTFFAFLVVLGLLAYKFQYVFVPAKIGNQPVYVWQYLQFMHKTYGKEAIQTLATQSIINQEIARNNVTVKQEDIQKEIDDLDKQASASGGIKAMLAAQQMSMEQLREQVRIQLAVKEVLKDKIAVTDGEVDETYKKNKDFFKGITEDEARTRVRSQLSNQKFQKEAGAWLADLRKRASIQILFPGLQ